MSCQPYAGAGLPDNRSRCRHAMATIPRRDWTRWRAGRTVGTGIIEDAIMNVMPPRGGRYLIQGGAVLSMDPGVGNLPRGDVLIDGGRIVDIGVDLAAHD